MNTVKIEFYDNEAKAFIDYTPFLTVPIKWAELLDEQLDEAEVMLKGVPKAYTHPTTRQTVNLKETFAPFTICRLTVTNTPNCRLTTELNEIVEANANNNYSTVEFIANVTRKETRVFWFFVANDRSLEKPVGSGRYNHDIYLIELTKIAERYIGDTLTFTNGLGSKYNDKTYARCDYVYERNLTGVSTTTSADSFFSSVIKNYNEKQFTITFPTAEELEQQEVLPTGVSFPNLAQGTITKMFSGVKNTFTGEWLTLTNNTILLNEGIYTAHYYYSATFSTTAGTIFQKLTLEYTFAVVKNRLPLKKWTVAGVIDRLFETVEPLRYDTATGTVETPRFYLKAETKTKLEKILAPEFAFTNETLRESLQQVGGYIHGEPRIINYDTESNRFEVDFDFYGGNEYSNISKQAYVTEQASHNVNQYCTTLDSPTGNLTNTLDWAQGVITEPYNGGARTVRTETTTTRLAEDNTTFIPTVKPIEIIGNKNNVICIYNDGNNDVEYDITPYIFENTDYSILSSYEGSYPFCKAYALYYTIGSPNIYGLFFKVPNAVSPIFREYAIVNILRAVTGNNDLELSGQEIMQLRFRVTYKPVYSARIRTHKQCILSGFSSTLAYNQGANKIETRYYSENLRGAVERMGNIEKTYTYHLAFLSQVPKIGTKFSSQYYITNVACELYPNFIKCTIALSKNFNRLSEHIGINTQKRMWEISERQAVSRESNINTYIVISESESANDLTTSQSASASLISSPARLIFNGYTSNRKTVSVVSVVPRDINHNAITGDVEIILPVVSSAFNTSLTFTFDFADNYSAGQKLTKYDGEEVEGVEEDTASGFWGEYVPYTDYYGRVYYLDYTLRYGAITISGDGDNANDLPQGNAGEQVGGAVLMRDYILYRKDNKEIPQITVQLTVVADNEDFIIGTTLCQNCTLVRNASKLIAVYAFKNNLNTLNSRIDNLADLIASGNAISVGGLTQILDNSIILPNYSGNDASEYKAWAIATIPSATTIAVAEEDGISETTQTIYEGGEILLAKNNSQLQGQTIYITAKNKIND